MGVRILEGSYDSGETRACLVDATQEIVFGPLFESREQAEAFVEWLPEDARSYNDFRLGQEFRSFTHRVGVA